LSVHPAWCGIVGNVEIVVDVVLLVLGVLAVVAGYTNGAIRAAGSLVGLGCGIALGLLLAPTVVGWGVAYGLTGVTQRSIVAAVVILVCAGVVYAIAAGVAALLGKVLRHGPIRWLDSLVGAVLGGLTWAVVVWLVAGFAMSTSLATVVQAASSSRVVATLNGIAPLPSSAVLGAMDDALASAGLPKVFEGDESIKTISAPDESVPAAVAGAAPSVVTILASKPACGVDSEGSGWVVQRGRVVTNAHVVAGASSIVVQESGSGAVDRATLIAFDPSRDLAVLDVTGLNAPALDIGQDLASGAQAYAVGYPGNGPFTVSPQRVRDQLVARGTDIYQSGSVERSIYSLRGTIRPGNSGGPLLDTSGAVVGVVFARSTVDPDTGYALTLAELRPVLSSVGSAPISSGACSAG
jgi:S1-C subfamily serine protease